ncbi:MAG: FAD-dependent monooxygenase [Candidatus Riflebacteria bacterium]|nr:FAD-dependent monooxygenase [Candidatus Riflebacteria bacterium]
MKIAVIGGGIAGFCAAIALGRVGVDVEIFERSPAIREIGAGLSLWPNATYALRELGLLVPYLKVSSSVQKIRLMNPSGREWASVRIISRETPSLCLDRPALLAELLAAVEPQRVHVNHECTGISLESEGPRKPCVHLEGGRTLTFDAVIGADGLGSVVRHFVTTRAERPIYRGYMIWRGVAQMLPSLYNKGNITETWGKGERFGIMPIGNGKVCWYVTCNQPDTALPQSKAEILEHFRGWHLPIPKIIAMTPDSAIVRTPALDRQTTRSLTRGRVVLIGDAAHPMTPNLGQGTCQAIEDALVLSLLLSQRGSIETAFSRFEKLRRARTAAIVLVSRWIGSFAQSESLAARLVRNNLPRLFLSSVIEKMFHAIHDYRPGAYLG